MKQAKHFSLIMFRKRISRWWLIYHHEQIMVKKIAPMKKEKVLETFKKSNPGNRFSLGNTLALNRNALKIDSNLFFDLYKRNTDIRQSVNKIALRVSKNGFYVEDANWNILSDNATNQLMLTLDRLFWTPTQMYFKKELFKQLLISWELYLIPMKSIDWKTTITFQVLDSRTMTKIYWKDWELIWFWQQDAKTGKSKKYTREEIAFYKLENHTDDENNGMSLLEWIIRDAMSDMESSKRNYYFFENDATPWGMLLLNDEMSQEEMQLAKEMYENQYKWSEKAHKTLVVWWVKDYKVMSMSARDMEFINQKKLTTDKVASCFWVPKTILWYTEWVNYTNANQQKEEFLEWTISPFERFYEYIVNSLIQKFLPNLTTEYIKCDSESIEDRKWIEDWQRADIRLWIITINEARLERDLEPYTDENADKPLIDKWLVLLEDVILDPTINMIWT